MIKECDTTEVVNNGRKPLSKEQEDAAFKKIRTVRAIEAL